MATPNNASAAPSSSAFSIGCSAALAAGVVDVSVALLNKPQDFATFSALELPILAVAVVFMTGFLVLWMLAKPLALRVSIRPDAAAAALAVGLFAFFTLALLVGLHVASPSPHAIFRAGILAMVSIAVGIGAASMVSLLPPSTRQTGRNVAWLMAAPIVAFEVLAYEWAQVYQITSVESLASVLASVLFAAIAAATLVAFARSSAPAAARALVVFVIALLATPALAVYVPGRAIEVRADVNRQPGAPRRVILITIDTLRRDAVSVYGRQNPTPAIDAFAADSVVFDNAWSTAPWTLPALASMITGLAPSVHGVTGLTSRLSDHVTTLSETLGKNGYRTAAIVHNPLLEPARNFAQGIDQYIDVHEPSYGDSVGARLLQALHTGVVPPATWPTPTDQTSLAIDWLQTNRNETFFLWVHYFDPHAPYAPPRNDLPAQLPPGMGPRFDQQAALAKGILVPPAATRQWIRELYDAEVRDVDSNVGRLIQTLKQLRLYDDALIVLSSDHGEEFWEHGSQGHGQSLHAELLEVPLIVKLPRSEIREHVPALVSTVSLAPTLLELCRIPFKPDDYSAPGLWALMKSGSPLPQAPVISSVVWTAGPYADERQAVTFDDFRYINAQIDGKEQLFDRHADPEEQHPLSAAEGDSVAMARHMLLEQAQRAKTLRARLQIDSTELGLDEGTLKQLRTLGYVH